MARKHALVTLVIGAEAERMAVLTKPFMAAYALRHDLQFITLSAGQADLLPHYGKYGLRELLERFARVLYLDIDILVHPLAPDLFPLVPEEAIGAYLASRHSDGHDDAIAAIQAQQGALGWEREYFNSGVMLLSERHSKLFDLSLGRNELFKEQTQLNYNARRLGYPIHDITFRFNHVQVGPESHLRAHSHFIHYAGPGHRAGPRSEQIAADIREFSAGHSAWAEVPLATWHAPDAQSTGGYTNGIE